MLKRPQVKDKVAAYNKDDGLSLAARFLSPEELRDLNMPTGSTEDVREEVNPNKIMGSAIRAHPSLIEYLTNDYYDRAMKVVIKDEYYCLAFCLGANQTWEDDYDDMVLELLDDEESCYIIYRLDETFRGKHFEHVLITWQPDDASLADRSRYTSSKSGLLELFEEGIFTYQLHGSRECDVDFNALKYVMMEEGEIAPLSEYEILKREALEEEEIERNRALKKIPDMDMDFEDDAIKEINKFIKGFINFLQMSIDNKKELIRISDSSNVTVDELPDKMPEDQPRFNLYRYTHLKNGQTREFIPVFIYYIPELGNARSKSLYPCAIDHLIKRLQGLGCGIKLRLEFSDLHDMTEGVLYESIYPPDRKELEAEFRAIKAPVRKAGQRGGWVKVLPV